MEAAPHRLLVAVLPLGERPLPLGIDDGGDSLGGSRDMFASIIPRVTVFVSCRRRRLGRFRFGCADRRPARKARMDDPLRAITRVLGGVCIVARCVFLLGRSRSTGNCVHLPHEASGRGRRPLPSALEIVIAADF